jgi:regulation of enolase protein 1 (concanavalin A-like superfamily)
LAAALLVGFVISGPGQAQQVQNLLTNGGFESGAIAPYGTYGNCTTEIVTDLVGAAVPEGPVEGKRCLHIVVPAAGANNWDVGMTDGSHTFEQGKKYTFAAFIKCKSGTLQIRLKPERGVDPWEAYNEAVVTVTDTWQEFYVTTPVITASVTPASPTFHFAFAPGDFWMDGIRLFEGDYVKPAFLKSFTADDPSPADAGGDVPHDPVLSWTAGPYAATHNVYFGTSFDDVNNADLSKAVSKGQAPTTFQPADLLEYGKTYYWRVDEVNAAPGTAVFKGDVWSFTVEPYAYPITGITATASSQEKTTTGPANTINGSGLTNDLHSTGSDSMWLSSMAGSTPVWIQYAFDRVYKLYELWVWNHNTEFEPVLGYGFKDVTIEYSTDGATWTLLKNTQFAQAAALPGYAHNTTVNLDGVLARFVRLTANTNWSFVGLKQCGLSEVRFFYIPVQARAPQPANSAGEVGLDAILDWRPGREATSHNVSFGTSKTAVTNGTATTETVAQHGFAPAALEFGTTYYWKVDEIGAETYPGSVWSFTTREFAAVDDFESYTDEEGSRIFDAWIDGYTSGNGSLVGYLNANAGTFGETVIVHGGRQSMPFEYNNVSAPYYSEAERTFDTPQDWTVSGADTLSLWYRGYPAGFADNGDNTFTLSSGGADIWGNADQFRFVFKPLNGNGSITARVDSLVRTDAWAKAGVMIRESLEANSKHASMVVTPDNSCSFQRRETTGAASTSANWTGTQVRAPYWVRVTRTSNTFKAESSPDGKTWTALGADLNITMAATAYVGLAITSHNPGAYSTAEFSNVAITGTVTGAWQSQSIGLTQWSNSAAPLYVTVEDRTGKKASVAHPDPAATSVAAWTEWQIPLSDLAGVNVAAVKKLTIGVGDKAGPKPGAAGMLYFDDIGFGRPKAAANVVNLLANGGFESGAVAPWSAYGATIEVVQQLPGAAVPEDPIEGNSCLHVTVSAPGANFWDNGLQHTGHVFEKGKQYTLAAFLKCKEGTLDINFKPELAADPWTGYGAQVLTMTDRWAEYYVTTPVLTEDVDPATITFHIGFAATEFWVDGVRFYEGPYVPAEAGGAPAPIVSLLPNPGFEDGVLAPWSTYGNVTTEVVTELKDAVVPESVIEGKYCLYLDVAPGVANFWEAGLQPSGEVFQAGKKYTISAFMKSKSGSLEVNMKPELGADPWTGYGEKMMTITETWAEYSVTTPVFQADVDPASFTFHIGSATRGFWVDAVRFYEGDYVPSGLGK